MVTIQHPYSQPLRGCFMWRSEALRALFAAAARLLHVAVRGASRLARPLKTN